MSTAVLGEPRSPARRLSRLVPRTALLAGVALVLLALGWASTRGAYAITLPELWQVGLQAVGASDAAAEPPAQYLVFMNIRLPRLLMGVAAGAGLGLAGALMQGLFRNPLADPGLIGVSSGAALAAAVTIVLGAHGFCRRSGRDGAHPRAGPGGRHHPHGADAAGRCGGECAGHVGPGLSQLHFHRRTVA
jgi:iron complex transport system permease protein